MRPFARNGRHPGGVARWAVALTSLIALGASSPGPNFAAARLACIPSVFSLCPSQALAGDHDGARRCLLRNLPRASPACRAAVHAVLASRDAGRVD
jgi:hypothetical protein